MSTYKITASKGVEVTVSVNDFHGNCGYRIMHDDRSINFASLTDSEKKYFNKVVFHLMCTDSFKDIRKMVLSEKVNRGSWLYNFIIDNNLLIGSPVSVNRGNTPRDTKTILAEFDPFDAPKPPMPRRPKNHKNIHNFISNIRITLLRRW